MAQYVLHVLGTVGIIETIVEFSYALVNLEDFTPFERAFFVASGTCEMMGELFVLGLMMKVVLGQENAPDALNLAEKYVKDPIHIYAFSPWEGEDGYDDKLESGAGVAIILALAPTVFWWLALTIMVFGTGFVSDGDDDIMLALAIVSLCCFFFVSGVLSSLYVAGIKLPKYLTEGYALLPCLYSVQKVFEVYLLLSRQDRLASDELGISLIAFQLVELSSCAMIVVKYHLVRFFERKKARRMALPQSAASPQATQAQLVTPQTVASPQQASSQQAGPPPQSASQPASPPQHVTPQQVPSPLVPSP